MRLFKPKSPAAEGLARREALACVPVRNPDVSEERRDSGVVRLSYPLTYRPWFGRLAARFGKWDQKPMIKRLELDELGTAVWDLVDNERDVRGIVTAFSERFQLHSREAELSVGAFFKELGKRGLVLMRMDGGEQEEGA